MRGRFALFLAASLIVTACVDMPVKHDPLSFAPDPPDKENIPRICKSTYESFFPRVAVVNFTNNTTFDYAEVVQTHVQGQGQQQAVGGASVGVAPGAAGAVLGTKEKRQLQRDAKKIQRRINAKLSESIEDGVMNELMSMGGAKVFTRTEMNKILNEYKFQQSGLVDDTQLVRLGKLAGIKYMVTGSVNNVNLAWRDYGSQQMGQPAQGKGAWGAALAGGVLAAQEGWDITTDVAVRIIDVETGEIVFSKIVSGREILGKMPVPSYDALIGGIKKAAAKGLEDCRPELSRWFTVKGYILQTRSSADGTERSALINIGEKQGLKGGQKLVVYTFQEIADPFDESKKSCDMIKLSVELVVTDQLQPEKAWVLIRGDKNAVKHVKVGQLVERSALTGQSLFKKLGY